MRELESSLQEFGDYSYRTECTYVDWVRRFLDYAAQQQAVPHPRVESEVVRDYLTHLAVRQRWARRSPEFDF